MLPALRPVLLTPHPHNLLLQSENIGTTWSNNTSVEELNVGADAFGVITLDRIVDNSAGGTGSPRMLQNITFEIGQLYCLSALLLQDQLTWGRLVVSSMGSLSINAYFDLANGVVGATIGAATLSYGMYRWGPGWRCYIGFRSDAADTTGTVELRVAENNNDDVVDLDGTSSIIVGNIQLNRGLKPVRYVRTTTAAIP